MVVPPGNEPGFGKWLDLMMLWLRVRERTKEEYSHLLSEAGLSIPASFQRFRMSALLKPAERYNDNGFFSKGLGKHTSTEMQVSVAEGCIPSLWKSV